MLIEPGDSWFSSKCVLAQPRVFGVGGRALIGLGGIALTKPIQTANANTLELGSETVGAKLHCQKGNSPDRQLRSQNHSSVENDVGRPRQPGGWLRSSHPLKKA